MKTRNIFLFFLIDDSFNVYHIPVEYGWLLAGSNGRTWPKYWKFWPKFKVGTPVDTPSDMLPLMPPFNPPGKVLNTLEVRPVGCKLVSETRAYIIPFKRTKFRDLSSQLFVPPDLKSELSKLKTMKPRKSVGKKYIHRKSIEDPRRKGKGEREREEPDGIFRIAEVWLEQKLGFLINLIAVRYAADKRD